MRILSACMLKHKRRCISKVTEIFAIQLTWIMHLVSAHLHLIQLWVVMWIDLHTDLTWRHSMNHDVHVLHTFIAMNCFPPPVTTESHKKLIWNWMFEREITSRMHYPNFMHCIATTSAASLSFIISMDVRSCIHTIKRGAFQKNHSQILCHKISHEKSSIRKLTEPLCWVSSVASRWKSYESVKWKSSLFFWK